MASNRPEDDLPAEFRKLGQNLKDAVAAAWHSEEAQKLQREIRSGLAALEQGLRGAAADLSHGPTGQRLKSEAADLGERVRSGQVEERVRADLLSALQTLNTQLERFASRQAAGGEAPPGKTAPGEPPSE